MQTSLKSRDIFLHAVRFVPQHISFTLYYFFLMFITEFLQAIRSLSSVVVKVDDIGAEQPYYSNLKDFLPESIQNLSLSPYAPYVLFALSFILMVLFLAVTFVIQALLRKRDATLVHEIHRAFSALIRAPWALVYLLALTGYISTLQFLIPINEINSATSPLIFLPAFGLMLLFFVVGLALLYYGQLLYDNYSSLSSVLETSWAYLKKSWFVLLKFMMIMGVCSIAALYIGWFIGSFITVPYVPVMVQVSIRAYLSLLGIIGFNMIYNHVRS
jgi:hypothetical protein